MHSAWQRPEAVDTRVIFQIYGTVTIGIGLTVYLWPWAVVSTLAAQLDLAGVPWGRFGLVRTMAAGVTTAGALAVALATVDDPISRRRLLYWFAAAHFLFGALFLIQWAAIFELVLTPWAAWTPFLAGVVLLYLAVTAPSLDAPMRRTHILLGPAERTPGRIVMVDTRLDAATLRSQYEEQIRLAARREERARLARDLHDAVKQQLFVIQTSAATASERYGSDEAGARAALDTVRSAAREATIEMEAMIEGLEAAPMGLAGLVEAIRKQCDALGFRTGATVAFGSARCRRNVRSRRARTMRSSAPRRRRSRMSAGTRARAMSSFGWASSTIGSSCRCRTIARGSTCSRRGTAWGFEIWGRAPRTSAGRSRSTAIPGAAPSSGCRRRAGSTRRVSTGVRR
jgi:signal transduction histidine kinase